MLRETKWVPRKETQETDSTLLVVFVSFNADVRYVPVRLPITSLFSIEPPDGKPSIVLYMHVCMLRSVRIISYGKFPKEPPVTITIIATRLSSPPK